MFNKFVEWKVFLDLVFKVGVNFDKDGDRGLNILSSLNLFFVDFVPIK